MVRQADRAMWAHYLSYMPGWGLSPSPAYIIHTWTIGILQRDRDRPPGQWEQWKYLLLSTYITQSLCCPRLPDFPKQKKGEGAVQVDFPCLSFGFSLFISPVWGVLSRSSNLPASMAKVQMWAVRGSFNAHTNLLTKGLLPLISTRLSPCLNPYNTNEKKMLKPFCFDSKQWTEKAREDIWEISLFLIEFYC